MRKRLLRAALVAGLPLCMLGAAVVGTTPAVAADKGSPPKNAVSKAIAKQVSDAQKAIVAKDWPTAIAKCKEAQAVAGLTDFDNYIINRFLAIAYLNSGDQVNATTTIAAAVENPAAPPDEMKQLLRPALQLENNQGNYPKVIEIGKRAEQLGLTDEQTLGEMAVAYFNMKDYDNAIVYAKKSIAEYDKLAKTPLYPVYQVWSFSLDMQKNRPEEIKAFERMVRDYGKAEDWGHLIDFALAELATSSRAYRETAALDIYRLDLTVGAMSNAADFKAMADVATLVHSPGDAQQALRAGLAKGVLTQAQIGTLLARTDADAKRDEPILPQAEATAAKKPTADEDVSVAEAYFGYGRYADAARVAQRATDKTGPKAMQARLLLGMAQAKQGDAAGAAQTLSSVTGDSSLVRVAELWKIYAARINPPAAPAAAGH